MKRPIQYPKPTNKPDLDGFLREVWQRLTNIQKLEKLSETATLEETIAKINKIIEMEG